MLNRIVPAAFILASLGFAACTIEKAPANPPPATPVAAAEPPPAPTVPTLQDCKPLGMWHVSGPAGTQEVKVVGSPTKPGQYDVAYKGATVGSGTGTADGQKFTVDLGKATGGQYNCTLGADCKTMSCGFAGQQPQVFTKAGE